MGSRTWARCFMSCALLKLTFRGTLGLVLEVITAIMTSTHYSTWTNVWARVQERGELKGVAALCFMLAWQPFFIMTNNHVGKLILKGSSSLLCLLHPVNRQEFVKCGKRVHNPLQSSKTDVYSVEKRYISFLIKYAPKEGTLIWIYKGTNVMVMGVGCCCLFFVSQLFKLLRHSPDSVGFSPTSLCSMRDHPALLLTQVKEVILVEPLYIPHGSQKSSCFSLCVDIC